MNLGLESDPEVDLGIDAYARQQAYLLGETRKSFCEMWEAPHRKVA